MSSSFLAETFERMLSEQMPNLFRLHVSPFVVQTCLTLSRYVSDVWPAQKGPDEKHQSFLANSFDEALSGAVKLARYSCCLAGRPIPGLILDPGRRLGSFASTQVGDARIEFVPGVTAWSENEDLATAAPCGTLVLVADENLEKQKELAVQLIRRDQPILIVCLHRACLDELRRGRLDWLRALAPDIAVFDESFVDHDVPFGAFTAKKELYDLWNRRGKTTFHSTTFQPNTICGLHFMRCLERDDPRMFAELAPVLKQIADDVVHRNDLYRQLYSPSLANAARLTHCDRASIRATGSYVHIDDTAVFDGVSGVACSVRGHNPPEYVRELNELDNPAQVAEELKARLQTLTGLGNVLPAVSGASAVESALKLALTANHPKSYVVALKAGFGGKTLLALTGTYNAAYKTNIDPLYRDVIYIDPFDATVLEQMEEIFANHLVAVVQVELIQGVGGVRRVPQRVLSFLDTGRDRFGYFLFMDEVQTGMYRTGPFVRSQSLGLSPDLLVIGKGASDMMFPFALVLYSERVRNRLEQTGTDLPAEIERRHGYEWGFRTVLNVLREAQGMGLEKRVDQAGDLTRQLLTDGLAGCSAVRDIRVFGQLIGIELNVKGWSKRRLRKRLFWFYLSGMLRHRRFPVLVGFCQYEPHVLKITPPLNATEAELRQMCATIIEVLQRPFLRLAATVAGDMALSIFPRR